MLAGPSQCSPRSSPRLRQASSREMSADWLGPEAENYSHSREGGSHAGARHSGSMPTNGRLAAAAPTEAAAKPVVNPALSRTRLPLLFLLST